jgi:hypothetical protein
VRAEPKSSARTRIASERGEDQTLGLG